jgi:hypothetical protein
MGDPVFGIQEQHPEFFLIKGLKRHIDMLEEVLGYVCWRSGNDLILDHPYKAAQVLLPGT